jgi:hypothetical protein
MDRLKLPAKTLSNLLDTMENSFSYLALTNEIEEVVRKKQETLFVSIKHFFDLCQKQKNSNAMVSQSVVMENIFFWKFIVYRLQLIKYFFFTAWNLSHC